MFDIKKFNASPVTACCKARRLVGWPPAWYRVAEGRVLCTYCGTTLEVRS